MCTRITPENLSFLTKTHRSNNNDIAIVNISYQKNAIWEPLCVIMRRLKQDRGDVNSVRVCMCIYLKETINFIPFVIYTRHKKPINRKRVWSWIYSLFQQTMTAESQTHTSIKQYAPIIHFSHTIPIGTEKWPPQNCLFERCSNKELKCERNPFSIS